MSLTEEIKREDLICYIEYQNNVRKQAYKYKNLGFEWNLKDFINLMRLLPPQNYGTRIETRIINKLNLKKVKSNQNKGDCVDEDNNFIEIKASIVDGINMYCNIANIRNYQDLDYYLVVCFDVRFADNLVLHSFILSKKEMIQECKILNATAQIGTKEANQLNENVEKRLSINIESDTFKRWKELYFLDLSDTI